MLLQYAVEQVLMVGWGTVNSLLGDCKFQNDSETGVNEAVIGITCYHCEP